MRPPLIWFFRSAALGVHFFLFPQEEESGSFFRGWLRSASTGKEGWNVSKKKPTSCSWSLLLGARTTEVA